MADKKKLLIYAHYFVPDVASTGQILKELSEGIKDRFDITVICVVPSYGGTVEDIYKTKKYYREEINGINVLRIRVPEFTKTNKLSRVKNILSYFFGAMSATFMVGSQDYVFSISQPPILGGLIGIWGKWIKRAKYIYNIQDFNPEQVIAVNYSKNKFLIKLMLIADKFSCRCANKVIVVGRDMEETLKRRFNNKKVPKHAFINNWIDENAIYPLKSDNENVIGFKNKYGIENKFVIMYSGNIGLYYDLENIIKVMKKFPEGTKTKEGKDVAFVFVGDGSLRDKLVEYKNANNMKNVVFIPYQDKKDLIYSLNGGDIHWCVNARGIKGVSVPSKCYGIMAVGKPIIGVLEKNSECELLINDAGCGLCCEPGDYAAVEKQIEWFINADIDTIESMGRKGRKYLTENLTREISVNKYARNILDC